MNLIQHSSAQNLHGKTDIIVNNNIYVPSLFLIIMFEVLCLGTHFTVFIF